VLLVAVLLAGAMLWNTLTALQQNFRLQQEVDRLQQEIEVLKLENDLLSFEEQYLSSDEFLLLSAKERLNKAEKGEKVIILPEAEPLPDSAVAEETIVRVQPSNFEQWLVFLFGRNQN
jgi:cell division protein FtsB